MPNAMSVTSVPSVPNAMNDGRNAYAMTDETSIRLAYERDPSYRLYGGAMNLWDRDYRNARLEQRNYLIDRPPVYDISRPQSTQWCLLRGGVPPILANEQMVQRSQAYFDTYLAEDARSCGLPTTDYCPEQRVYDDRFVNEQTDGVMLGCGGYTTMPVVRQQQQRAIYNASQSAMKYPLGVSGVNINIDADSRLKRLDHYCPRDIGDSRIDMTKMSTDKLLTNGVSVGHVREMYPDCYKPMDGIATPMVWNNMTKELNRYRCVDYRA